MSKPLTNPKPSTPRPPSPTPPPLHDVLIIGAGPCGLALAARLHEPTPSALFTDAEHARYHWIRKHGRRMSIVRSKDKKGTVLAAKPDTGRDGASTVPGDEGRAYKTVVLDASGDSWLASWNRLFALFGIEQLRSPMFFHVDPRDRDGLLAYAHESGREGELREIRGCVGKEASKHRRKQRWGSRAVEGLTGKATDRARVEIDERDRKDYYTPSRALFANHCSCVVDRYGLREGLIRQERVRDIDFSYVDAVCEKDRIFIVTTNKTTLYARVVVLAVGAGNAPGIPELDSMRPGMEIGEEGCCHASQIVEFPHPRVAEKIKRGRPTSVSIVGGGLTSAQLTNLAIGRGVSKVWHIMRGNLKVKPFDIDLSWMGKFKNHEKAAFWSADSDEDRLNAIRTARNGGSITSTYQKLLQQHTRTGRLSLHTHTALSGRRFSPDSGTWSITTTPPLSELEATAVDYVYFATGISSDFAALPFLQTLLAKYPLHGHGGLPCLSEDLMWRGTVHGACGGASYARGRTLAREKRAPETDAVVRNQVSAERVPLFVTGRLASLRLGPGGGNLEGARVGAERIAWALGEVLGDAGVCGGKSSDCVVCEGSVNAGNEEGSGDIGEEQIQDAAYRYMVGLGSRFESLSSSVGDGGRGSEWVIDRRPSLKTAYMIGLKRHC